MVMKLHPAAQYLRYKLKAGNAHGLHSPFVFELYNNVIRDDMPFYDFEPIERIRERFIRDETRIQVTDFGVGGEREQIHLTTVQEVARKSLNTAKYGRLLFRLVNHFQPKTIIELGTSLGITTLYLATPVAKSKIYTIEGCPVIQQLAKKAFQQAGRQNIVSINGEFDKELPLVLNKLEYVDMVYIDGNHRYQPTMNYFNQCLEKITDNSVFIFDDINWSREMTHAWKDIKKHPSVTVSVDLYRLGIVLFKKELLKQDFVLRY